MTVAEAVKQSKNRGLFHKRLIEHAQKQIAADEDLVCAAIVMVTRMVSDPAHEKMNYLNRMERSSKIKAVFCATTKRLLFYSYALGSGIAYELPLHENPTLDAAEAKNGVGVGGLRIYDRKACYYITGNRKLIHFLKSGIMAAFMIYQDHFIPKAQERTDNPD